MSDPGNCDCSPCNDVVVQSTPGAPGAPGGAGAPGADGVAAFTLLSAAFTMPAVSIDGVATVLNTAWLSAGQPVFLETAGSMLVSSITDATHVRLVNLGYSGNAAPGTIIGSTRKLSASGIKGADGGASSTALNNISPTTTKGDLIVDNGANSPSASDVRLAVGTNGKALVADSTQATGLNYATITPNAGTDNAIVALDGAAGTPIPLQERKIIITDDGALQSTPTGGNARGSKAVDLQVSRGGAAQVASGSKATISGGDSNTASGSGATIAGGTNNAATGQNSVVSGGSGNNATNTAAAIAGGTSNLSSGQGSAIIGGTFNLASGTGSIVLGGSFNASTNSFSVSFGSGALASRYGERAQAAGSFATAGDAQTGQLVLRGTTTNATPTEIFLDGAGVRITLTDKMTLAFRMLIVARRTDAANTSAAYQLMGVIRQQVGVATCALVAAVTKTVLGEDDATWDVAATADAVNGALVLTVTGAAANNINWVATVELTQVIG